MDGKSLDLYRQRLEQLRAWLPEAFPEQQLDWQRLRQALGQENTPSAPEYYQLSWPSKSQARQEAFTPTTATLTPIREQSINFDEAKHIFIEGENLEVLKILQKAYFGQIKMIYIDPPYNTGNDSFVYPDNFAETRASYKARTQSELWQKNTRDNGRFHSLWLSMMYPRLYLSRNLLREDGVIFISIDDNEIDNLKLLCNEIFGEENYVATIVWEKKYAPANDAKYLSTTHEYILLYAKNKMVWRPILEERTPAMNARYKNIDNDPRGPWKPGGFSVKTYSPSYDYPIKTPSGKIVHPPKGGCWQTSEARYFELLKDNRIYFGKNGDAKPQIKQFLNEVKQGLVTKTLWSHSEVGSTQVAMQELESLLGNKFFDTPKPTRLIQKMLHITVQKDENALILDFFAGSGTLAQAVLEANAADQGNRRFVCVQLPEPLPEGSHAHKAGFTHIAQITRERIQKAIERLQEQLQFSAQVPPGVAVYRLSPSHFKAWQSQAKDEVEIAQQLFDYQKTTKEDAQGEALLTELLLKLGIPLQAHPITKTPEGFYQVGAYWFCFQPYQPMHTERILSGQPGHVVFLGESFVTDHDLANLKANLALHQINLTVV
ncbi:MAG: site-specific DNA-methyltransferase [Bernardetiaceae bacterium]